MYKRSFVGWEAFIPPSKVTTQLPIDDTDSHLQKLMFALRIPTHLLTLGHSFIDELIDRRLNKGTGYPLARSIPLTMATWAWTASWAPVISCGYASETFAIPLRPPTPFHKPSKDAYFALEVC